MNQVLAVGAVDAITTATSGLLPDLLAIGGAGVVVGAAVFALRKGWKIFRGTV